MSSIEKAMERQPPKGREGGAGDPGHGNMAPSPPSPEGGMEGVHHIDLSGLKDQGMLIPDRGAHNLAEEYRMIKRPLLRNAFGRGAAPVPHGNLVMIVSALSGEGKTFTALNLAMSIAMERDTTALLVDSDVIKPSLSASLGLGDHLGLTDLLQDDSLNMGQTIVNTNVPKLKVLPAGRTNVHSTELLASRRMERLAEELSARYSDRIVLFDSPPLLVTSQACVLSQQMGQILIVVEAGRTSQSAVKEALGMLDTDKVIGMVLNKKPRPIFGQDYRPYGYGWGDGQLEGGA